MKRISDQDKYKLRIYASNIIKELARRRASLDAESDFYRFVDCLEGHPDLTAGNSDSYAINDFNIAFSNYISRETHYNLDRQGWKWDDNERKFKRDDNELTEGDYQRERDHILRAFTYLALSRLSPGKKLEDIRVFNSLESAVFFIN